MQIVLIAAVAENGVIGRGGTMPWRLKSDMRHFRALTMGKPVVMGRKTYLSLAIKPLPGRTNIVVTRDASFTAPGVLVARSLEAALEAARGDALRRGTRHHGDRRRGDLRAGDAACRPAGDHPDPLRARRAIRPSRRSIRRSGARRRVQPHPAGRGR